MSISILVTAMDGDMILGIIQVGILHGTAHIGADLIAGDGDQVGEASTLAGILHGITGIGVHITAGVAAITAVMAAITAAIGDIIITTAADLHTAISMDALQLHVRAEIMRAVTALPDHDPIYRQAEACRHALLPTETRLYAAVKQGAAHR